MSLTTEKLKATLDEIKEFYLTTNRPIILANSLGKDSMTVLELFMLGLKDIPPSKRRNLIYIESVDTLVEAPPMAEYIKMQIKDIKAKIAKMKLPMKFIQLRPEITNTFFVNVIGKGYKTPDQSMRWCTDRLKIKPTNLFLKNIIRSDDGVITVTGQRSDESLNRARTLQKYILEGKIQKDGSNPKNLIYTPIKDWSTEEVWNFLKANHVMTNDKIEKLYEEGNANKNVFAGNRMGCWCCTVVDNDKALEQFCEHGYNLKPLLAYRNYLKAMAVDKTTRYIIRRKGENTISLYTIEARIDLLKRLLEAQKEANTQLIRSDELKAIDKLWRVDRAPVTVKQVWDSVYYKKSLPRQLELKFLSSSTKELRSKSGTLNELFEEIWEANTFVEIVADKTGVATISKGYGFEELINGTPVWVISHTETYYYDLEAHSLLKDFFRFVGFSVLPDETEQSTHIKSKEFLAKTNLFENSYWRLSKEPDGQIFCTYGIYQPSRFGDTHYKVLGREKGENLNYVILKARENFMKNPKIFKAFPQVTITLSNGQKAKLTKEKINQIIEGKMKPIFFMTLREIKADFLKMGFDPVRMSDMGKLMLRSFSYMYGGFYQLNSRSLSWALIPAHTIGEFGALASIAAGWENILSVEPIKCKYKYNRQLIAEYKAKLAQDLVPEEKQNQGLFLQSA